jgi:hypothetical protein
VHHAGLRFSSNRTPSPRCYRLCHAWRVGGAANAQALVLTGATVYAAPEAAPLPDAVVLTSGGVITRIGSRSELEIPAHARLIDCTGKTVVAGFWNSHVHFTQAVWQNAADAPAAPLRDHMREMLTRWGFTTVWDLGSDRRLPGAAPARRLRRNSGPQDTSRRGYVPQRRSSGLFAG